MKKLIAIWIISAIINYNLCKHTQVDHPPYKPWSNGDRVLATSLCLILGPIGVALVFLAAELPKQEWTSRPASW